VLVRRPPVFLPDDEAGAGGLRPPNAVHSLRVRRSPNNPLISFGSSRTLAEKRRGYNISGPSVIRVPEWIENPLGRYYMYFSHHKGSTLRLAYADDLHGPWTVYEPGTLTLPESRPFRDHIASPDVHVDEQSKEVRMYFHGCVRRRYRDNLSGRSRQWSGVALSDDGLRFSCTKTILGIYYFRVFRRGGLYYAIDRDGVVSSSGDGLGPFERRSKAREARPLVPGVRHCAVLQKGDQLLVFYSRQGDAPERILMSSVELTGDWDQWVASRPIEVVQPETDYEGVAFPLTPSKGGSAVCVRQLRDPAVYEEDDKIYLFYSVAGEMGIALAELEMETLPNRPGSRVE